MEREVILRNALNVYGHTSTGWAYGSGRPRGNPTGQLAVHRGCRLATGTGHRRSDTGATH